MQGEDFSQLIKACRNFDRRAQRRMLDRLAPFLSGLCRRYAPEATQDLTQEALIIIFNNINNCLPEERPFMAWCKRIAVNVCLGRLRKRKTPFESLDDDEIAARPVPPDVLQHFGVAEILHLLDSLPENQRLAFNLYVIDGYSHAEIAAMLHIKESSSRSYLAQARAALQALLTAPTHARYAY